MQILMKIKMIDQVYSQVLKIFDTCLGTQGAFLLKKKKEKPLFKAVVYILS